jgi:cyclopropane fatty-acyl-phospholipid synthase-like methyltransferase
MESRRFRTAAAHYAVGRTAYPPAFIAEVARAARLTRADRILDLGTGPGVLALAFAPHVGSVLAVDPEPEMLALAAEAVRTAGAAVEVRSGSSETLGPEWGRFRAVTMGRSFHWMDRDETLRRLDTLLEPDGAVLLFNDEHTDVPENAAIRAWSAVVERYSADDRLRMERRSPEWQRHEAVLRRSAFREVEAVRAVHQAATTIELLVHRALSMSATSESRLGPRADTMLAEIRTALAPFAASGPLVEVLEWTALLGRRPPVSSG